MRPPPRPRIPTQSTPAPLAGLGTAFAGIELPNLPPGQATAAPSPAPAAPKSSGRVVLRRETAQRGGKTVIVLDQFDAALTNEDLETLARQLRNLCGCGGTRRDRAIELQGRDVAKVRAFLEEKGYRVAGEK